MIEVIEDPSGTPLVTDYVFDTLGNLRKTTQGEQVRYFTYDSLGRILQSEAGRTGCELQSCTLNCRSNNRQ